MKYCEDCGSQAQRYIVTRYRILKVLGKTVVIKENVQSKVCSYCLASVCELMISKKHMVRIELECLFQ